MVDTLGRPSVAVVGARAASPTGQRIGYELGRDLALAGLVVVSGLARGVDGAAHAGALDGGGRTVAVLGCGVDVVYPRQHGALAARVAAQGVIVSEFPPGTEPRPSHFPLRNRIISGLSRAVVVVEASEQSGSLITAQMALEQGRDVLAVPGTWPAGRYRGCHALIKDGARLVETVEDVLEEIGWRPAGATLACNRAQARAVERLGRHHGRRASRIRSTNWPSDWAGRPPNCWPNWAALETGRAGGPDGGRQFRQA